MKAAEYSAVELKNVGYDITELKGVYSISQMKEADYSASEMKNVGYTLQQLSDVGYASGDLFNLLNPSMTNLGFTSLGSFSPSWASGKTCYLWSKTSTTYYWGAYGKDVSSIAGTSVLSSISDTTVGNGLTISNNILNSNDNDFMTEFAASSGYNSPTDYDTIWKMLNDTRTSTGDTGLFIPSLGELKESRAGSSTLSSFMDSDNKIRIWSSSVLYDNPKYDTWIWDYLNSKFATIVRFTFHYICVVARVL